MPTIRIQENIDLAPFTMYKIGGPARFFAEAASGGEIAEAVAFASVKKVPFVILGAGSNVLISEKGFDGLVIRISGGRVVVEGDALTVDAGMMMARAVTESANAELTGFEWGIGVPGTIGGSVRGNAGCFGGEMRDVVASVRMLNAETLGEQTMSNAECEFGYRDSIFKRKPELIILSATLRLKKGDRGAVQTSIRTITLERVSKQDIGVKCCGCIFKNISWDRPGIDKEKLLREFPEFFQFSNRPNIPAAYLLDVSGLKDTCSAHACISAKHANYFVNNGGATSQEIKELIDRAREGVEKKFGIRIEEEIQYIGFDE